MTDWRELPPRGLPPGSRLAKGRLANGLEVRLAEVPAARQARLALGVAAGWLDEPPRHRGLAHLLEHCLFHPRREGLALADWVGAAGGRYNARTSEATTDYHLSLPAAQLAEGLARLVDLVAAPDLLTDEAAPEAVAREIAVIDAEFRARRGDPALHRLAALSRLVAVEHPARGCHAGHRLSLGGAPCPALRAFHRRHYRASRMVLASLAPQPLAHQWAAIQAAGQRLPGGGGGHAVGVSNAVAWRWTAPGGVAWRSPGVSGALELLWPLQPGTRAQHADALEALALGLEDGELAAVLCRRGWLQDLSATAWPEGAGEALALTLRLSESGERHWGEAAELCRSRLASLLARSDDPGAPARLPEEALATWPQRQVRRHCALNRCRAEAPAPAVQLSGTLPRLLLACRELPPGQVRRVPESATPWVPLAWPRRGPPPPPWPGDADPVRWVAASQRRGHQGEPRRCAERPLTVWRGGTSRRPWLCLGWPASGERLAAWETASLPLRQAFRARGGELWLGEDARGAWLALRGEEALPPVALALLEAWPRAALPRAPGAGLLAQRLLARLSQAEATPSLPLCWAEAPPAPMLRRRLLEVASAAVAGGRPDRRREASVAPQGEGTALMLLFQGESTPLERLCLRLLGQCHDRPFLVEMRECRGLGYVAAVRYREAAGRPRLGYVVQSPGADAETLRLAIEDFLAVQGRALLPSGGDELARRLAALRADLAVPESEAEAWRCQWQALREGTCEPDWRRLERSLEALDGEVLRGCLERLLARPDAWQWHRLQAAACHLGRSGVAGERHSSAISPRSGAP